MSDEGPGYKLPETDPVITYTYTQVVKDLPMPRLPLWRRLWARRPQIRTLRSEHFKLRMKRRWWDPKDRAAARISLQVLEHNLEEHRREVSKAFSRYVMFGELPEGMEPPT